MKYIIFVFSALSALLATMANGQASGHITTIVAGQTFDNYAPVFIASDGKAYKASVSDASFAPVGIAIDTALAVGDTVQILHSGIVYEFPGLTSSKKYYLGSVDGAGSEFSPAVGPYYEVGRAVNGGLDLLVDIKAAGVSGVTRKNKTADESRVSNTTLAADNTLTAPLAVGTYRIEAYLDLNIATALGDYKYSTTFDGTASAQSLRRVHTVCGTTTTVTQYTNGAIPSTAVTGTTFGLGGVEIRGTIIVTAPGTFRILWAQNTSDPAAITAKEGSYLEITRIK